MCRLAGSANIRTGIEFAAELHDLCASDIRRVSCSWLPLVILPTAHSTMARSLPSSTSPSSEHYMRFFVLTCSLRAHSETSDRILAAFDEKLQEYAMNRFQREGMCVYR